QQGVADRLRTRGLLEEVAEAGCPEVGERRGRSFLLVAVRRVFPAAQPGHEQVDVDTDQTLRSHATHRVSDGGPDVTALGDVARVTESLHELGPRERRADGVPSEFRRLAGEPVAGNG